MSEPFLSEIKIVSFNFPPKGWAFCNGQTMPINQNQALFSLLGTTYGGNGQTTFALPNLRGRTPIHFGASHTLGEAAGSTAVTITNSQMPQHTHVLKSGAANAAQNAAVDNLPAVAGSNLYGQPTNPTTLNPVVVGNLGGSQPHTNMMPYLVLNFCIALQGIFPSQN
ncbi:phage tail protein [Verrucomicrobiota bacterium sgz303538]